MCTPRNFMNVIIIQSSTSDEGDGVIFDVYLVLKTWPQLHGIAGDMDDKFLNKQLRSLRNI